MPSRRHKRQTGPMYRATKPPGLSDHPCSLCMTITLTRQGGNYTRRRFGGRHPLCGIGVTSRMRLMANPAACKERSAESRPAPGPFTCTWTVRMPASAALRAALSAATWAANGVPLREPLNPTVPALAHATTFPCGSVIVTIVLLKVEWTFTIPSGTDRLTFFLRCVGRSPAFGMSDLLVLHEVTSAPVPACDRLRCVAVLYASGHWCGCVAPAQASSTGVAAPGMRRYQRSA